MARNKFDIDETLQSEFNIRHLGRLLKYMKPYRGKVVFTVFTMLVASVANLLGPYLIKVAMDTDIPKANIKGLIGLSLIFLLTLVINGLTVKAKIKTMNEIGQSIIYKLREDLFAHLQELPFTFYDSRPHGKILIRVVNYVNSMSDLLSNGLVNFITDLFSLFVILFFMLAINVKLTLISMAGLPVLMVVIFFIKTAQRRAWQLVSNKQSNMNAYIHESITGMKVTESFAREKVNYGIFDNLNKTVRKTWMRAIRIQFLLGPSVDNISQWTVAAVYIMGISWLDKGITIGILFAFMGYIGRFWAPISNIANFYNQIINTMSYMDRIFETLDEKVLVADVPGAVQMPEIKGAVEFEHVKFSYEVGDRIILNDVNFKVKPGETIALVGPTGAGKTTVVNLISRFYDIQEGRVLIDEVDIKGVTLRSLRKQMGIMLQDSFIFSGTIMDNIRYGRLDATDEEVIAAAQAVRAHEFIMAMENGYMTEVNERGTRLSTGQRQLISFARALLADPKILILDEATSSIDTKTEIALQEGLDRLLKGRTSFIIAHRLSTIKNANRIMYIDHGNIMEGGTHDELIEKKGYYYKLYSAQYEFLKELSYKEEEKSAI